MCFVWIYTCIWQQYPTISIVNTISQIVTIQSLDWHETTENMKDRTVLSILWPSFVQVTDSFQVSAMLFEVGCAGVFLFFYRPARAWLLLGYTWTLLRNDKQCEWDVGLANRGITLQIELRVDNNSRTVSEKEPPIITAAM